MKEYDVIVAGGGHAGIEAALAAGKMGCSVAMVTMEKNGIGKMSCNPCIGGSAKGHLVHEIDVLGGAMGLIADKTGIQFRILNKSKGPAIWAGRCQSDRDLYTEEAVKVLTKALNEDPEYRYSWQANIAVYFQDVYSENQKKYKNIKDIHEISNEAADRFLNILCR